MSHKRKIIEKHKERWSESQDDAYNFLYGLSDTVKQYFLRMTAFIIILFISSIIFYNVIPLFGELVMVIPVCTTIFLLHELLHLIVTRHFKYKIEWYPVSLIKILGHTFQMQGFDVLFPSKRAQQKHAKLIGYTPYIVIFPLSILFLLTPFLTLQISGAILLITHLCNISSEGKTSVE